MRAPQTIALSRERADAVRAAVATCASLLVHASLAASWLRSCGAETVAPPLLREYRGADRPMVAVELVELPVTLTTARPPPALRAEQTAPPPQPTPPPIEKRESKPKPTPADAGATPAMQSRVPVKLGAQSVQEVVLPTTMPDVAARLETGAPSPKDAATQPRAEPPPEAKLPDNIQHFLRGAAASTTFDAVDSPFIGAANHDGNSTVTASAEAFAEVPVDTTRLAIDPVDELRASLGFGSTLVDVSGQSGRALPANGTASAPPARRAAGGPAAPIAATRSTPVGRYTEQIYATIESQWLAETLPVDARGLGGRIEAMVAFEVTRAGTVEKLRVFEPSGVGAFDALAIRAIPERLPPLPADVRALLGSGTLAQYVKFVYQDAKLSVDGTP